MIFVFSYNQGIFWLSLAVKSKSTLVDAMKKLMLILWLQCLVGILPSPAALANIVSARPSGCNATQFKPELELSALIYIPPILGIVLIGTSNVLRSRLRDSNTNE